MEGLWIWGCSYLKSKALQLSLQWLLIPKVHPGLFGTAQQGLFEFEVCRDVT
jgi:hypothetical protein